MCFFSWNIVQTLSQTKHHSLSVMLQFIQMRVYHFPGQIHLLSLGLLRFAGCALWCDPQQIKGCLGGIQQNGTYFGRKKGCPTMGYEWYTSKMPNIQISNIWKLTLTTVQKVVFVDIKLHDGTSQTSQKTLVFPQMGVRHLTFSSHPLQLQRVSALAGIKFGVGNGCLGSPCGWDCCCLGSVTRIICYCQYKIVCRINEHR